MFVYDMVASTACTTVPTTTRRLRSLHLPSSSSTTELSRRFNSLRRSANSSNPTFHHATTSPISPLTTCSPPPPAPSKPSTTSKVRIKLVPNVGIANRCFVFDVVDRELERGGPVLKLGRYSDRTIVSDRLSFKSKVVSRYHAEIWLSDIDGKIYIKDSGSSSGTFVNHIRLTAANTESTSPHEIMDGDLIQLGVDYKGGIEPMYRAVRMRLEVNRQEVNANYRLTAFQQQIHSKEEDIQECCICLYCIAPSQALFIAPCSHVYHYRCLRPLLAQNYPGFSCPLCRAYSNLEASVALEESDVLQMLGRTPALIVTSSEEESEDNCPLVIQNLARHQREKTVLDEENQQVLYQQ
ncbi:SMAD/FHA domain-containing protein [Choanephora cucurbitarum]|nr:SMAD/FHA domain-containing protein [Choanephora cucurbitarum]